MTEDELERIVREVVRGLTAARNRGHDVIASPPSDNHATLQIDDPVISMQTLEGKLEGIHDVVVARSAVVTPLVRDELRARQIRLRRDVIGTTASQVPLKIVCHGTVTELRHIKTMGDSEVCHTRSLEQARDALARSVNAQTFGVLLTANPEAAVCVINRDSTLHAFVGLSETNVRRARATMAANVIVLPRRDDDLAKQRRLVEVFRTTREVV